MVSHYLSSDGLGAVPIKLGQRAGPEVVVHELHMAPLQADGGSVMVLVMYRRNRPQ